MEILFPNFKELLTLAWFKGALAALMAFALEMAGHPESAARWLFWLMLADLLLGLSRAWGGEEGFRAVKIRRGAWKFFRYWLAVAVFVMADAAIKKALPFHAVSLRDCFIAYLAVNEAFSCVDHLAFFGMPVPEPLLKRMREYRNDCVTGQWDGVNRRKFGERRNGRNEEE